MMTTIMIGELYFPDTERHFQVFGDGIADYQRPQREKAFEYVQDWRRAIDLGANVGIFSRHFAEKFGEVWAIEPLRANIECLEKNVPNNVLIKKMAVGDENREVSIYLTPKSLGGAFVFDHAEVGRPPLKVIDETLMEVVPMVTLDSLELDHVGLFKLDIQGSEVIALRGAEQTLKRCRPVILIEEKPVGGPDGSIEHVEIATDLLVSFGYVPKERVGADRVFVFTTDRMRIGATGEWGPLIPRPAEQ